MLLINTHIVSFVNIYFYQTIFFYCWKDKFCAGGVEADVFQI